MKGVWEVCEWIELCSACFSELHNSHFLHGNTRKQLHSPHKLNHEEQTRVEDQKLKINLVWP